MSGKYVKVPVPPGNESTYVKTLREQSKSCPECGGGCKNPEQVLRLGPDACWNSWHSAEGK